MLEAIWEFLWLIVEALEGEEPNERGRGPPADKDGLSSGQDERVERGKDAALFLGAIAMGCRIISGMLDDSDRECAVMYDSVTGTRLVRSWKTRTR